LADGPIVQWLGSWTKISRSPGYWQGSLICHDDPCLCQLNDVLYHLAFNELDIMIITRLLGAGDEESDFM